MKRFPFTFQKSAGLLVSLSLSSCQVSPEWAYDSRSLNVTPHFQHAQGPGVSAVGHPNQALQMTAPYGHAQATPTYLEASRMVQPAPMMIPRHQVFVPQQPRPQPKAVVAPRPQPRPQTSQKASIPRGKVRFVNGRAIAPADAPAVVRRAVEAGNRMNKFPYKWGGGHALLDDTGYDCSGAVSYVLREAGIMPDQRTSSGFLNFGEAGAGDWITVWAKDGHVFMTVGGLRLDTGGSTTRTGPRWKPESRHYSGFVARHPRGL